jgi:hypothetical protein
MNGRKPRQIRLEALESRELLSASPSISVPAEVATADTVSAAGSSVALDGIMSGGATKTVTTSASSSSSAELPIRGRGIIFPLLGVFVQGSITVSGPPSNTSVQGQLVATGRQGSVTIDIKAPTVQLTQLGDTSTLTPFAVEADVVSGTGRLANEMAHGIGVLQLDGTVRPKVDQAALTGTFTLSIHLPPTS